MAASSCASSINLVNKITSRPYQSARKHAECSFPRSRDLHAPARFDDRVLLPKHRDLVIRKATPEVAAAADVVSSSLSIPGIPFAIPTDNPWLTAFAGLFVGVPFVIQRLLALSKQVDAAAQTMENIADTVGKVAEEVDKAAENLKESLPEGGLKQMVELVEDMAEETVKDAQVIEDLMDKVGELDDKLEEMINKSKGPNKA